MKGPEQTLETVLRAVFDPVDAETIADLLGGIDDDAEHVTLTAALDEQSFFTYAKRDDRQGRDPPQLTLLIEESYDVLRTERAMVPAIASEYTLIQDPVTGAEVLVRMNERYEETIPVRSDLDHFEIALPTVEAFATRIGADPRAPMSAEDVRVELKTMALREEIEAQL